MSRKSRRRMREAERDDSYIASGRSLFRPTMRDIDDVVGDRRRFEPDPYELPAVVDWSRDAADVVPRQEQRRRKPAAKAQRVFSFARYYADSFREPKRVAVCVRRKERREVWFAKKLRRRGGGGNRRNMWSDVKC